MENTKLTAQYLLEPNPDKYYRTKGGMETKQLMLMALGEEGMENVCVGIAIKYLMRYNDKEDAVKDLNKAIAYINMIIDIKTGQFKKEMATDFITSNVDENSIDHVYNMITDLFEEYDR